MFQETIEFVYLDMGQEAMKKPTKRNNVGMLDLPSTNIGMHFTKTVSYVSGRMWNPS
jgi:hypothetical protein